MISVNEAKAAVIKNTALLSTEVVSIDKAYNSVLAEDIYSPIVHPPFNQSAMDGYAFIYNDLVANKTISIVGEVAAGETFSKELKSGEAVRIFTGAAVPAGADCVVMQEKISIEQEIHLIISDEGLNEFSNIRKTGSQIQEGEFALGKGTTLTAGAIGYISGMGISKVSVFRKPNVSIIVTGSELVKPGNKLGYGQIYESNSYALVAALNSMHIQPTSIQSVPDIETEVFDIIKNAIHTSDVVLLSGGISVGDYDFVGKVLQQMNVENIFYKIKQKPGKPLFFGKLNNVLIFALPGNPAAVLSCFYNYVYPALREIQGFESVFLKSIKLPISRDYKKKAGLANFLKSKTENDTVVPLDGQESYILSSFAIADSMIYLPEESENIKAGTEVEVMILP